MATEAPELETVATHWRVALDTAEHAVCAPGNALSARDLERMRARLQEERRETAYLLGALARMLRRRLDPQ